MLCFEGFESGVKVTYCIYFYFTCLNLSVV